MRVYHGLWMILVSVLGLLTWPIEGQAHYEYDSRRAYDICSPDQIETIDGVKVEWGHHRQWQTVNGAFPVPFDDRLGLHNSQGRTPVSPEARKQDPENALPRTQLRIFTGLGNPLS